MESIKTGITLSEEQAQTVAVEWIKGVYERIRNMVKNDEKNGRLQFKEALLVEDDHLTQYERRERFISSIASGIIEEITDGNECFSDMLKDEDSLSSFMWDEAVNHGYLVPDDD